jgi:hypothetical protein
MGCSKHDSSPGTITRWWRKDEREPVTAAVWATTAVLFDTMHCAYRGAMGAMGAMGAVMAPVARKTR